MANQIGLLKARGHRKGQNRFWPMAAGQKRQKLGSAHSAIHLSTQQDCARINKSVQDPLSPFVPLWSDLGDCYMAQMVDTHPLDSFGWSMTL